MSSQHICGLFFTTSDYIRRYLPQVRLESHTRLTPVSFTTQLRQTFHNPGRASPGEVRYTFPLYDGVAVNGYTISFADEKITGIVKQKDDARETYQAAVDQGETAALLESLPAGVFGVTLGNIPANVDIIVDIQYSGELRHDAGIDGLRYTLPTSIAPRYGEYPGEIIPSNTINAGGISIVVDADMGHSAIRGVQSPSHPISVSTGSVSTDEAKSTFMPGKASATLSRGTTELGQDFILQLTIDDISKPQAIVETHPTIPHQRAIMATLVPKFALQPIHPELVFIADQSGSMGGSKNDSLKSALTVFLKSLPLGVRFNIIAFGSSFKSLWPKSQAYNETNVKIATDFVSTFNAGYGGTDILEPVKAAFEQRLEDMPLEVMLLTDGEIWGEAAVFDYINSQIEGSNSNGKSKPPVDARVFALGIGGDVSHTLVEGVARAGNGFAQFVSADEETDQKVIRMLKAALYAHTTDYALEVHYADDGASDESASDMDFELVERVNDALVIKESLATETAAPHKLAPKSFFDESANLDQGTSSQQGRYSHLPVLDPPALLQAPAKIPPLFPFNRSTTYILLGPTTCKKAVTSITLRAKSADGPLELNVPVQNVGEGLTVHQLAARRAMHDLEEGRGWLLNAKIGSTTVKEKYESRFDELVEREAVRIGVGFQVAGKWTSFVGVENAEGTDQAGRGFGASTPMRHRLLRGSTARSLIGGSAPRKQLASRAARKAAPSNSSVLPPPAGKPGTAWQSPSLSISAPVMFAAPAPPPAPAPGAAQPAPALASIAVTSERRSTARFSGSAQPDEMLDFGTTTDSQTNTDTMHKLIALQTFSGAWPRSALDLIQIPAKDVAAVFTLLKKQKNSLGLDASTLELICATALALGFLKKKCGHKKEVWELVADKGVVFMEGHLDETAVQELCRHAHDLI